MPRPRPLAALTLLLACEGAARYPDGTSGTTIATTGATSPAGPTSDTPTSDTPTSDAPTSDTTTGTPGTGEAGTTSDPGGQLPDFGDHTPTTPLLLFADTEQGRLSLWWAPKRLGDTVEGSIGAAFLDQGEWVRFGPALPFAPAPVDGAHVVVVAEALVLPFGTHPFGPDTETATVTIDGNFVADELICGTLSVELASGTFVPLTGFVARPLVDVGGEAEPPLICD